MKITHDYRHRNANNAKMQTMTQSKDGAGIQAGASRVLFRLVKNWNLDSPLITHRCGIRRRTRSTFTLILALNQTVGDSKNGVNDDSVDAFGNLVLYLSISD